METRVKERIRRRKHTTKGRFTCTEHTRNDGKITSKSGLVLNGVSYYGEPRTARSGEKLVVKSTVVPQRSARVWDR